MSDISNILATPIVGQTFDEDELRKELEVLKLEDLAEKFPAVPWHPWTPPMAVDKGIGDDGDIAKVERSTS